MKPGHTGLRRVVMATRFTAHGLAAAWRYEASFRQECIAAAVLVPAAFWVGTSAVEIALLVGVCAFVLVVELLNSALEAVVDRLTAVPDALARRAKDMGSAAVAMSLVLVGAVWAIIGWQRFA